MIGRALRIIALQTLQFFLLVLNMRCIVIRSILGTLGSDALIAFNSIALTKFVVQAETLGDKLSYVVGGCLGSLLALLASPWLESHL